VPASGGAVKARGAAAAFHACWAVGRLVRNTLKRLGTAACSRTDGVTRTDRGRGGVGRGT